MTKVCMKDTMLSFFGNAVVSAIIGIMVYSAEIVMQVYQPGMLSGFVQSAVIGVVIGTVCYVTCYLLSGYLGDNVFRYLGVIFLILFVAAVLLSRIYPTTRTHFLLYLVIVEAFGLLLGYWNIRYSVKLNTGLKKKQARISQKRT